MSDHRDELAMPWELAAATKREQRQGRLARLPAAIGDLETDWSIRVGEPFQPGGQTAWVAPVTRDGEDLVVKVLWRHPEAEHEADGLRIWDGDGAVVLHAVAEVDPMTIALLLERCRPGTTLQALPEAEQDPIVAGLLRRLWRQPGPGHRFHSLHSMCEQWAEEFEQETTEHPSRLDPGLCREGIELFRQLISTRNTRCCCAPTCMPATSLPPSGSHECSSTPNPTSATRPMTLSSTCSTATSVCTPSPIGCWPASLTCLNSTPSAYGPVSGARLATVRGQRSVNGSFDVQAGGGEYGYRAVRVGDRQSDFGAAEHVTLGAGLNQAHDDVAIGLPGLLAEYPQAQLVVDDAVHLGSVSRWRDEHPQAVAGELVAVEVLLHRHPRRRRTAARS